MAEQYSDRRAKKPSLYWQQNDRRIADDQLYSPFRPRQTPLPIQVGDLPVDGSTERKSDRKPS